MRTNAWQPQMGVLPTAKPKRGAQLDAEWWGGAVFCDETGEGGWLLPCSDASNPICSRPSNCWQAVVETAELFS